jgi:pimeloyl-ACP methyl ester carboxylesterase
MTPRRPLFRAGGILRFALLVAAVGLFSAACSDSGDRSVMEGGAPAAPGTGAGAASGAAPSASPAPEAAPEAAPAADRTRRIDIGGYEMRYLLAGSGSPTVVLDAPLGNALDIWGNVFDDLAEVTEVLAYDRLGLGYSDPGPKPRTARQIAQELKLLLDKLEIAPPYVLVGQGTGGFHMRLFAEMYPDDVAGMVFVNANHEDLQERRKEMMGEESWNAYMAAVEQFFQNQPEGPRAEWEAYEESRVEARDAGPLPEVPIVVVTGMNVTDESRKRGVDDQLVALQYELQHEWAVAAGERGTHLVTEKAGPNVSTEDPDIVLEAIRQVVEAVRAK